MIVGERVIKALGADPGVLGKGELDFGTGLEPGAVRGTGISNCAFERQFTETYSQDPEQYVTTNVDGRQVQELLTTERNAKVSQKYDLGHLLRSAEAAINHFETLATMGKEKI